MWDSNPQETDFESAVSASCNQPGMWLTTKGSNLELSESESDALPIELVVNIWYPDSGSNAEPTL